MKSRITLAVSALTLGTALAVVPSFAQAPSNGTTSGNTAQQGSSGCVVFQQGCSDKPYPMNNGEQSGTSQSRATQSTQRPSGERLSSEQQRATRSNVEPERMAQQPQRGTGETYRLGERDRYNDYAPGVQIGAAASGGTQWCEMRFRSYNPATGTFMASTAFRTPARKQSGPL